MSRPSRSTRLRALTALALLTGSLPLLSCSDGLTTPSELTGGLWKLQWMELPGAPRFVPDNPDRFTIEFRADSRVSVMADCNLCGGEYSLSGATLSVRAMACTLALCAGPGGGDFANLIEGTSTIDRSPGQLTIRTAEGRLVLRR